MEPIENDGRNSNPTVCSPSSNSRIAGDGYNLLIAAIGKIPDDIKLCRLSALEIALSIGRVIPFEFLGDKPNSPAICIHPDWFERFDEIVGKK